MIETMTMLMNHDNSARAKHSSRHRPDQGDTPPRSMMSMEKEKKTNQPATPSQSYIVKSPVCLLGRDSESSVRRCQCDDEMTWKCWRARLSALSRTADLRSYTFPRSIPNCWQCASLPIRKRVAQRCGWRRRCFVGEYKLMLLTVGNLTKNEQSCGVVNKRGRMTTMC